MMQIGNFTVSDKLAYLVAGLAVILVGVYVLQIDYVQAGTLLAVGVGLLLYAKADSNSTAIKDVAAKLQQVVLCGKPPEAPACVYEIKAEACDVVKK